MANSYCSECGKPADSRDAKACTNCGKPFGSSQAVYAKEKSTVAAILLSFFFPGAGQVYNGELKKAILMLVGYGIGFWLILPIFFVWIYSMYDAYNVAEKMNKGEVPFVESTTQDAVIYIVAYFTTIFLIMILFIFLHLIVYILYILKSYTSYTY